MSRHWELLVAADFFTVEVWTCRGLQRFVVLFFLDLSSRGPKIAGIGAQANGLWMSQIGRNHRDPVDGVFVGKRCLIHDRDPLFTAEFQGMLAQRRVFGGGYCVLGERYELALGDDKLASRSDPIGSSWFLGFCLSGLVANDEICQRT